MEDNEIKAMLADLVREGLQDQLGSLKGAGSDIQDNLAPKKFKATPENKGVSLGRVTRAIAAGGNDYDRAAHFAKKAWDDDLGVSIHKALQAGDFDAGGFMLPEEFMPEMIELLRNASVVRRANPRVLPMPNGTLTLPRQNGTASASYVGEADRIPTSQPEGGQLVLTAKKLVGLVPVANELLQYSAGNSADEFIRDDLVATVSTREDQAFLRDDGTQNKPKGIRSWVPAAHVNNSAGTSLANIRQDFATLFQTLRSANVRMLRPAIFMSERSKSYLQFQVVDAGGRLVFSEELSRGSLFNVPVFTTNNIPDNLGSGDKSEVYLVDMADAIIGETSSLVLSASDTASFNDGSSDKSSFQHDMTLVRAITKHDFVMRHSVAVAVTDEVAWGA